MAEGVGAEVFDPALIRAHFDGEVQILDDGAGGIVEVPVRSREDATDPSPAT